MNESKMEQNVCRVLYRNKLKSKCIWHVEQKYIILLAAYYVLKLLRTQQLLLLLGGVLFASAEWITGNQSKFSYKLYTTIMCFCECVCVKYNTHTHTARNGEMRNRYFDFTANRTQFSCFKVNNENNCIIFFLSPSHMHMIKVLPGSDAMVCIYGTGKIILK